MITEDYVSFETAKLLKEKGFDEKCRTYYKVFPKSKIAAIYHSSENRGVSEDDPNEILCPTIHMAMKWLREVHHLFIQIEYECEDCFVSDIYMTNGENISIILRHLSIVKLMSRHAKLLSSIA